MAHDEDTNVLATDICRTELFFGADDSRVASRHPIDHDDSVNFTVMVVSTSMGSPFSSVGL